MYKTTSTNPNPKGEIKKHNLSGRNLIRAACNLGENPMGENPKNRVGE